MVTVVCLFVSDRVLPAVLRGYDPGMIPSLAAAEASYQAVEGSQRDGSDLETTRKAW